jgi:hypothetical protein
LSSSALALVSILLEWYGIYEAVTTGFIDPQAELNVLQIINGFEDI